MATGISSSELVELAAYETIDPPLGHRIDAGFAALMCIVYNRTRSRTEPAKRVEDFMPDYGLEHEEHVADKVKGAFTVLSERQKLHRG